MILLDVRALDHPLPLEMAVDAFRNLSGGEVLHMIHRREPLPLFTIIAQNKGRYLSYEDSEGVWHIYITRDSGIDLEAYRV